MEFPTTEELLEMTVDELLSYIGDLDDVIKTFEPGGLQAMIDGKAALAKLPPSTERKAIRVAAGVSQDAVADYLGCTRGAVHMWEKEGGHNPKWSVAVRYLRLLERLAV
jgi:DNA-binding XRE family transcriptional regulator